MLDIPEQLAALRRLAIEDQARIVGAATAAGLSAWRSYFPYLYGFAQGGSRTLLWEAEDDAVCLYILRLRQEVLRLDLYLPPFPFSARALRRAQGRVNEFNRSSSCEIVWLEEAQRPVIESMGFHTEFRESEYLYDSQQVRSLDGPPFARLRRNISKARRIPDVNLRDYQPQDEAACLALLRDWRDALRDSKGVDVKSHTYMSRCVRNAFAIDSDMLRGTVALVGGRVVGFCFGGRMRHALGNLYVCITDHELPLLGYLLRQDFVACSEGMERFNDGSDAGREGVALVKRAFNPVAMLPLYRAR